jgi:hypothetical protein
MGTTLDGYQHLAGFQRDCCRQAREALGETAFQAAYRQARLHLTSAGSRLGRRVTTGR